MAVTSVTNIGYRGGQGGMTNDKGVTEFTEVYQVITDSASDGIVTVGSAAGIPGIFDPHPDNIFATVRSVAPRRVAGSRIEWEVTVDYSTDQDAPEEKEENPINRPPVVTWGFNKMSVIAVKDVNGDAIINSAGFAFDPPPMKEISRPVVSVTSNVPIVPTWILDYQDAVNDGQFEVGGVTVETGKAKIQSISVGPLESENDEWFHQLTIEIEFDKDGWDLSILDEGYHEMVSEGGELKSKRILSTSDNQPVTEPVLLNGLGSALTPQQISDNGEVYLSFTVYTAKDFGVLNLPP